jgi:hypothetical protein
VGIVAMLLYVSYYSGEDYANVMCLWIGLPRYSFCKKGSYLSKYLCLPTAVSSKQ